MSESALKERDYKESHRKRVRRYAKEHRGPSLAKVVTRSDLPVAMLHGHRCTPRSLVTLGLTLRQ
jgi:hypothetical protein